MSVKKFVKSIQFLNLWLIGIKFSNCERPQNRIAYILRSIGKETSKTFLTTAEQKQQATKNQVCSTKIFQKKKHTHLEKLNLLTNAEGLMRTRGKLIRSKYFQFAQKHLIVLNSKNTM